MTSGGKATGSVDLTVSSDYLTGKDPSAVYETCVMAKSGEAADPAPLHATRLERLIPMVQFSLPKNSKVRTGKTWPKPEGKDLRKFQIYR